MYASPVYISPWLQSEMPMLEPDDSGVGSPVGNSRDVGSLILWKADQRWWQHPRLCYAASKLLVVQHARASACTALFAHLRWPQSLHRLRTLNCMTSSSQRQKQEGHTLEHLQSDLLPIPQPISGNMKSSIGEVDIDSSVALGTVGAVLDDLVLCAAAGRLFSGTSSAILPSVGIMRLPKDGSLTQAFDPSQRGW
ncbi:hypothetical protein BAUCODRAFT_333202 [Baudoinia panamericana UAMH 10762]|uniref:Uncharacterized protein n=1 Tax=Baudoinia panamericana (strain UAMH 10762) TaxID=717646 RepID=M2MID0_BAUPA|nr:uncharacterized protein BAUCODRAFT_333202 [Baudoinia panamericana UAMH 10762]EMC91018.1 hypothetical protein BAUCODRAFT_333202 [Baudoinia panamericana UAMH 10762]